MVGWGFLVIFVVLLLILFGFFLFVFFLRMQWFHMREMICLLIVQNVAVHGFSGFYRLPLQVREHLIPFKLSMSAGELCSADLIVKLVLGAGVCCSCWVLQTKDFLLLSGAQECLQLENKEVAPGGFVFVTWISAPACKSVSKDLTK